MENQPASPETLTTNLTDVTERARRQLGELIELKESFTTNPPHFYIEAPAYEAGYTDYIDKGCRGGWTEYNHRSLDREPYEVSALSKQYGRLNLMLQRDGKYVGDIGLRAEDLSAVKFYEDTEAIGREQEPGEVDELIQGASAVPYLHLRRLSEYFDDRYNIIAISREPLVHPISLQSRDRRDTIALSHEIESLELLQSDDGSLAKLHFASNAPRPDSGWLPLEHIRLTMKEREPREMLTQQLFRATLRLLAFYDAMPARDISMQSIPVDELNDLLQGSTVSVRHYPDKRVPNPHYDRPSFIVGTPSDSGVEDIRRIEGPSHCFDSPFITANRIVSDSSTAWVIDEAADLALPLIEPSLSAKESIYSVHFNEYTHKK